NCIFKDNNGYFGERKYLFYYLLFFFTVGIDPLNSGTTSSGTGCRLPGIRPFSILGGPVGAGAFAGLRTAESLQQSNAPSPSAEAAAGTRQTNPAPGAGGRTDPTITVVVDNPKHPDYVNIDSRVSSYQGWPDYLDQTPRQMSEAGFFYDGVTDSTRCYCCGGLRNWEPGDDPMLEHTRWFPHCEYINKLKGERYVAAVQRWHQEHGGESIPLQPTEDPESRDRSLLALSQPCTQRALGRTGQSYSTIIAPRRNNVATGFRSNVGIDPLNSGSSSSGTGSQLPGIRPSSLLGGPVGACTFSGLRTAGPNTGALTSFPRATEGLQQSNTPSPSVEAASGTRQTNPAPGAGGKTDPTITVVVDNPKHPDYVNIDSRVSSYQGWPEYLDQTQRQMSEAGFFYVGVADFTRCYCCGGGLRNWEPGDDPMLEHTRWFPHCEYVNKLKGERYVAAVQRRHQKHMAEQQRQQKEIAQRRDENRNPPDPMTTEAAAVMREMGYSVDRTKEAILAVRLQTGSLVVTTQQVLTWLQDEEESRLTGNSSNTGTSIPSSVVHRGTSIGTSIVNTTSSIYTATSIVSAGTATSTVSSSSGSVAAEVQQSCTSASVTAGESSWALSEPAD
ncbi:baculoviral IAP repeat-containing protein 3-like, partial [Mercenaria mercenaria]|uniref:baculoviral IAP repeat-containing protein 3-like n=1 Tax=Mercenaria mercenaria TaxID=6596 RepID=UPI00234F2A46